MKNLIYSFLIALLFLLCQCKDNVTYLPLPAATQEGKNTFGCLVDKQLFLPDNPISISCNYQHITSKELYFFYLGAGNSESFKVGTATSFTTKRSIISILIDSITLKEGDIIPLNAGNAGGLYYSTTEPPDFYSYQPINPYSYLTNDTLVGEIHFTRFDTVNNIVSGTFWFNALYVSSGKIVRITDGRFDTHILNH